MKFKVLFVLGILSFMFISTSIGTLTSNNLAIVSYKHNITYILNTTDNTTINVTTGGSTYSPLFVSRAYDGSGDLVVTAIKMPFTNIANGNGGKVFLVDGITGTIKDSFTTTYDIFSCRKTEYFYYCGSRGNNEGGDTWIYKFALDGSPISQTSTGDAFATTEDEMYPIDVDVVNEVIYASVYSDAINKRYIKTYDIYDLSLIGTSSELTNQAVLWIEYNRENGLLEVDGYNTATVYYYNFDEDRIVDSQVTSKTANVGLDPRVTTTGSLLSATTGGDHFYEDDGVTSYDWTFDIGDNNDKVGQHLYTEIYVVDESPLDYGIPIKFYADWNKDGDYQDYNNKYDNATIIYSVRGNAIAIHYDYLMYDLNVTIYDNYETEVGKYTTNSLGEIYPTLVDGIIYKLVLDFANADSDVVKYKLYSADGLNVSVQNLGFWEVSTVDGNHQIVDNVSTTFFSYWNSSITQTKIPYSYQYKTAFYTKAEKISSLRWEMWDVQSTKLNWIMIDKDDFPEPQVFTNTIGFYYVTMGQQNYFITDLEGNRNEVTTVPETIEAGDLITQVYLKIYKRGVGFLKNKNQFRIINLEIEDKDGVCNEERFTQQKRIPTVTKYIAYLGVPNGCDYINAVNIPTIPEGTEAFACEVGTTFPYSDKFDVLRNHKGKLPHSTQTGTWDIFTLSEQFSIFEGGITLNKVVGTVDEWCIGEQGQGADGSLGFCFYDVVCSKQTTNTIKLTLEINGEDHFAEATYDVTQGIIEYGEPWVTNQESTYQLFKQPAWVGFGDAITEEAVCTVNITWDDATTSLYTLDKLMMGDGWNLLQTEINAGFGAKRSNVSYSYNTTCSGGGYATSSDAGTVFVSDVGYDYWGASECQVIPNILATNQTVQLRCDLRTQENSAPITITVDTDMGGGTNYKTLVKTDSDLSSLGYNRLYKNLTNFTNVADGNSYTVTFTIDGGGNYANQTITDTITIDDSISDITIDNVKLDKSSYVEGDDVTCSVRYTGTNLQQARVEIYSLGYYNGFMNGTKTESLYKESRQIANWDSNTVNGVAQSLGGDQYYIEFTMRGTKTCSDSQDGWVEANDETLECLEAEGLLLMESDTVVCNWEINYQEDSDTATYSGGTRGELVGIFTDWRKALEFVLDFVFQPLIMLFLLILAFFSTFIFIQSRRD